MLKLTSESRDGFFAFRRIGSSRGIGFHGGILMSRYFVYFADLQDGSGNEGGNEKKKRNTNKGVDNTVAKTGGQRQAISLV